MTDSLPRFGSEDADERNRLLSPGQTDADRGRYGLSGIAIAVFGSGAFTIEPQIDMILTGAEIGIVVLFAIEYVAGFAQASSRTTFVRNPWRLLDALIIIAGLVALLSVVHGALLSSPTLRLLRLTRLTLFGTRSSMALIEPAGRPKTPALSQPTVFEAHALLTGDLPRFEPVDWPTVISRVGTDTEDWLFVSGVGPQHLGPISSAFGIPEIALRRRLFDATFPRFDRLERFAAFFAWYPASNGSTASQTIQVTRTGVLLGGSAQNVIVLSREHTALLPAVERCLRELDPAIPTLVRATYALLHEILTAYERVVERLEDAIVRLETGDVMLRDRDFLQRTFQLRSEISRVRGNLRHLKEVVRGLSHKRIAIHGFEADHQPLFLLLADDAEDLYQVVDDLREGLAALVDFRLNVSSFQMNKVIHVLALLTTLALIPSVAGGLLGMNLTGSPWSATLSQVTFGVAAGMALSLYIFMVKGWLR